MRQAGGDALGAGGEGCIGGVGRGGGDDAEEDGEAVGVLRDEGRGGRVVFEGAGAGVPAVGVDGWGEGGGARGPESGFFGLGHPGCEVGRGEQRVIEDHLRLRVVEARLPSGPVAEAGHVHQARGVGHLAVDVVHQVVVFGPDGGEPGGVVGVEDVVVAADHGPHVVGCAGLLEEGL